MPSRCSSQYSLAKAGSVPSRCVTSYCRGARRCFSAASSGLLVFTGYLPGLSGLAGRPWRGTSARGRLVRLHPLLVRRHPFSYDVQEVVGPGIAEEAELPAQRGDGGVEVGVRTQPAVEVAGPAVEGQHRLSIGDGRLDLAPVADDARVLGETVDIVAGEGGDRSRIEGHEGLAEAVPLDFDHAPAHAALEDGLGQVFEVVGELGGLDLLRCLHRGTPAGRCLSAGGSACGRPPCTDYSRGGGPPTHEQRSTGAALSS